MTIIAIAIPAELQELAGRLERLTTAHRALKARATTLEEWKNDLQKAVEWNANLRQALELEVRQQQRQLADQGVEIEGLRAEAERVELLERQLAAQDQLILEMRAALHLAKLPTESRSNVIDLVQAAA
ncbi:hypothetical protein ACUXVY_18845 [Chromobacterium haemolyticum]|uniref:hypothetical protein n=1 Tax=Chromobacterium haemolyticum TaxID=394935 RepID=UPI004055F9AC